jgi:hypothetical protein
MSAIISVAIISVSVIRLNVIRGAIAASIIYTSAGCAVGGFRGHHKQKGCYNADPLHAILFYHLLNEEICAIDSQHGHKIPAFALPPIFTKELPTQKP